MFCRNSQLVTYKLESVKFAVINYIDWSYVYNHKKLYNPNNISATKCKNVRIRSYRINNAKTREPACRYNAALNAYLRSRRTACSESYCTRLQNERALLQQATAYLDQVNMARSIAVTTKINYDDPNFKPSRLYLPVRLEKGTSLALIDSGADVNVISENLINKLVPDWKLLDNAGVITVKSHTKNKLPVNAAKWMNLKLNGIKPLNTKFIITKDKNEFILGNEFLQENCINVHRDNHDNQKMGYITIKQDNNTHEIPLTFDRDYVEGRNINALTIAAGANAYVQMQVATQLNAKQAICASISNHAHLKRDTRNLIVYPTLSEIMHHDNVTYVSALVHNNSKHACTLKSNDLTCSVEEIDDSDDLISINELSSADNLKRFMQMLEEENVHYVRQIINDHYGETDNDDMREMFGETDILNFEDEIGENSGKSQCKERYIDPIHLLPFKETDPQYHEMMKKLFCEKYQSIIARHDYDAGNISKTLGYLYVPITKELPKSRKIYYADTKNLRFMHDILLNMQKYGHIKKTQATYGAPVFLIKRKSPQAPMRLLCAICDVNDAISPKPVSILPNISRVLETLGKDSVGMISVLDLKQAFHSLRVYPGHTNRLSFLTPFGAFKFVTGAMGLTHIPTVFQSKVWEAIHTDPNTRQPDMLEYCAPYLDDIPIVTPRMETEKETIQLHYQMLDKVCYRLKYHNFKLSAEKMVLFKKEAAILGHILSDDKIQIDPKRIDKMKKAPYPASRKGIQVWCGFLASIKYFSPPSIAKWNAILTPLTGANTIFKFTDLHRQAFDEIKNILSKEDFVLAVPNPDKPKLLYVDSSQLIAAAILLEVDFGPSFVVQKEIDLKTTISFQVCDGIKENIIKNNLNIELAAIFETKDTSLYDAIADQIIRLGMNNFPTKSIEIRTAIIACLDTHPNKHIFEKICKFEHSDWHDFCNTHTKIDMKPDNTGIMIMGAAAYLQRDIIIMTDEPNANAIEVITANKDSHNKPALWIGKYIYNKEQKGSYISLINIKANIYNSYTTFDRLHNELRELNANEMAEQIRTMLKPKSGIKYKTKVISYFSKIVSKNDRHRAIYELEAQALISCLHHLKHYIIPAPAVLACIDSRTAYFLFSPGIYLSALKVRRWNVLLSTEYPNLILHLVPSEQNWADVLTRVFDLPEKVIDQFDLKRHVVPNAPHMDFKFVSCHEAEQLATENDIAARKDISVQSLTLDTINNISIPFLLLKQRMSGDNLSTAQKESEHLIKSINDIKWVKDQLRIGTKQLLYIPPSLEGVAIAYSHLITGHSGAMKLYQYMKQKYFFPLMRKKIFLFAKGCQPCIVTNKLTGRKGPLGRFPIPSYAFECIFMDLLESLPSNTMKIKHLLVLTDYLSKNVYTYGLKNKKAESVLECFKTFIMHTNMATKVVFTDNGTCFREKSFVATLNAMGINVPKTTAHSSKSRGAVEVQNKLITILIQKMLLISPESNFHDIHFLAALLLNNSYHPAIKSIPAEVVYGQTQLHSGPWGTGITSPPLTSRLLSASLKEHIAALNKIIKNRVKVAAEQIVKTRRLYEKYHNKNVLKNTHYKPGDIVFIRNFTLPPTGVSYKFRPVLSKSPYVVLEDHVRTIMCARLTDNYTIQAHKDHLRKLTPRGKLFKDLPDAVKRIVGGEINHETMRELARVDPMDIIYQDHIQHAPNQILTRARRRRMQAEQAAELISDDDDDDDDDEDDDYTGDDASGEQRNSAPNNNVTSQEQNNRRVQFESNI